MTFGVSDGRPSFRKTCDGSSQCAVQAQHQPLSHHGNPETPFPKKLQRSRYGGEVRSPIAVIAGLSEKRRERRPGNPALTGWSKLCRISVRSERSSSSDATLAATIRSGTDRDSEMARCKSEATYVARTAKQGKGQKGGRRIELRP